MSSGSRLAALTPHDLATVPAVLTGGVVAIGNFDGVHRGHAALLAGATGLASDLAAPAVVLTFEPHPRTLFRPAEPVFRLTPLAAKARLLDALGLTGLVVATFDRTFAATTAPEFISDVLVARLNPRAVVVGPDFHFGKDRTGTPAMLADAGKQHGFSVEVVQQVRDDGGQPISSSAIRDNLAAGDVSNANRSLGYRWFVAGTVIAGDRRGRELGFPTANIALGSDCRLRHGIYAVRLQRPGGPVLDGVASYGRRPTFGGGAPLLEVFVFDFAGDLYGEEVAVIFVDWIRPELAFASVADLVTAMESDAATARAILAGAPAGTALDERLAQLA
jgi:riboflavin kinase/FMN adenylyltransferase